MGCVGLPIHLTETSLQMTGTVFITNTVFFLAVHNYRLARHEDATLIVTF